MIVKKCTSLASILLVVVVAALFGTQMASADTEPRIEALAIAPCLVPGFLVGLDPQDPRCASPDSLKRQNDRVLAAKTDAANAYDRFLNGLGTQQELAREEERVLRLTGERGVPMLPSPVSLNGQRAIHVDPSPLRESFWPFEQINSYYCGPATAQSILNFLGVKKSPVRNPFNGEVETLTGDAERDQRVLAGRFWLAADRYEGTNWGEFYMPFTLNAWRDSRWFVLDATPALAGGRLTKDQALRNIRYATDRSYPVAENVVYAAHTYYPPGFHPGIRYTHWDTIYGHLEDGGKQYVQIGQVYHGEGLEHRRFTNVEWDVHWRAIEARHGLVW